MQPAGLTPQVFSTAGLPDARRVELWESHNAAALIGLAVHARDPLAATEVNVQLPVVQLARVAGSPHVVERTAEVIRRDPVEAVAVYLPLRGDSWFQQDGCSRVLRPGQVLACDADRPFARGFARGLEELVVKVPRAALAAHADLDAAQESRVTSAASDPYAAALARLAARATDTGHPVPPHEGTLLDLVAVLVAGRQAGQTIAHRAAARAFIEDHLTDADLGAGRIADAIGISERQLSRVFAAHGMSVPRHILARRLQLAYSVLTCGAAGNGPLPVADVAARCGFSSAAYFSHAFAEHFGRRASDVRGAAREVPA
jgi:AraC-like DNA-binding protein